MKPFSLLALALLGIAIATVDAQAQRAEPAAAPRAATAATPAPDRDGDEAKLRERIAAIDDILQLEQLGNRLAAAGRHSAAAHVWKRLAELRPHLGRYQLQLAAAHAQLDRKSQAYSTLLDLQRQGYAYDLSEDRRFDKVATTELWTFVLAGFRANAQPFGTGELAMTLPAEDLLLESIAWDPQRKQLLVGSARKGAVYRIGPDGALQPLVTADEKNGLWAVMDIAVDGERGVLWVASTAIPHFDGYQPERDLGRAGVFKFDLKTGRFLDSYLSPAVVGQNFFISSLAVGRRGEVYAADGVNNAVYVVRGDEYKRLFHAPRLSGLRGMTVDGSGDTLYFADAQRGIMGFDLKTGKPFDVRVPAELALGGAEGLVWHGGVLLLVQQGMQPDRIMKLHLSADGRSISGVTPLEANKPGLSAPTAATLGERYLYVIANSQKSNYDRFGLLRDPKALEGTRIWRVDPEFGKAPPELPGKRDIRISPSGSTPAGKPGKSGRD